MLIEDIKWAWCLVRVRRWRRNLKFSQRTLFDDALRPQFKEGDLVSHIQYPDALYYVKHHDFKRAMYDSIGGMRINR